MNLSKQFEDAKKSSFEANSSCSQPNDLSNNSNDVIREDQ